METKASIIDEYGRYQLGTEEAIELLLQNKDIDGCFFVDEEDVLLYNANVGKVLGSEKLKMYEKESLSFEDFHARLQSSWVTPWEYTLLDMKQELISLCETDVERDRVNAEYQLFEKHEMIELIRFMKYFMDIVQRNSLVIGVGRGSSVSLYSLYLLGIHRVDSIRYGLDYSEFFK